MSSTAPQKLQDPSTNFIIEPSEAVRKTSLSDFLDPDLWQSNATSSLGSDVTKDASVTAAHVSLRVSVAGTKVGTLRYFGDIDLKPGVFCGVELDEPEGLNDGSVQGIRYFTCRPNHGIIAPVDIVKPLYGGQRKHSPNGSISSRRINTTFCLEESGPFSLLDGLISPKDKHMDNDLETSLREQIFSDGLLQHSSPLSTPTPSSTASSSAALWECRSDPHLHKGSFTGEETSLSPEKMICSNFMPCTTQTGQPQELTKQSSFELDESLGILTPDQMVDFTVCGDGAVTGHGFPFEDTTSNQHQLKSCREISKQNFFEIEESMGILTPDQMACCGCCGENVISENRLSYEDHIMSQQDLKSLQDHSKQNMFQCEENMNLDFNSYKASSFMRQFMSLDDSDEQPIPQQHKCSQDLSAQSSFELDDSLGILTPDQMAGFSSNSANNSKRNSSYDENGSANFEECRERRSSRGSISKEDLPLNRLPSELDVSSSNYPSSEFPKETPQFQIEAKVITTKSEDVTMQELDISRDQKHCASNKMLDLTMCEDLSDNVCPAVTSKSSTPASIRIGQDMSDRTLSPEDLPMDAPFQQVIGEILQKVEVTCGTSDSGRDTSGISGATSAGPSSRSSAAPPAPSSFVTSVTSITSLDNGYQGDGEWSRPASRGADHSPTSHRVIKLKTADPMTDSDFFTESDADMHDEMAASTGRGDRRAQVIDGTLYGANLHAGGAVLLSHQHQRCHSFTASINEEMESSGVYSDLERRPEDTSSDGKEFQTEERIAVIGDFSPDGSTKTVSSRSEQSQVKETPQPFTTIISQTISENMVDSPMAMDTTEPPTDLLLENNIKNNQMNVVTVEAAEISDRGLHKTEVSAPIIMESQNTSSNPAMNISANNKSKEENQKLKKYKMPKRNVVSKIKAMIESSSTSNQRNCTGSASTEDENQENRRPTRSPSKSMRKNGGRWDAVMNKIAQGQAEQKLKTKSLKEVKSKVFANITSSPSQQSEGMPSRSRKTNSSTLGQFSNSRSMKENSPLKTKSRRARTRTSTSSLSQQQQQTTGNSSAPGGVSSHNSSPHSSISDVSVNQNHTLGKASTKSVSSLRSSKKRDVGRSTSPLSDGSTNSTVSHVMTRSTSNHLPPLNHHTQKNGVSVTAVADMKTPPVRKQASRRSAPSSGQKPTPLRDHNRQQQAGGGGVFKTGAGTPPASKPGERSPPVSQPQPTPVEILLPQLRHNAAGFEALGVLVQHLVFNLDAFSTPQLQKNLESMKTEWLKTKLELEEAQVSYRRIEDVLNQEKMLHSQKIEELKSAQHCILNKHSHEQNSLMVQHEAQISAMEKRMNEQLDEMKCRYEIEVSTLNKQHTEKLESVLAEGRVRLEHMQHEHEKIVENFQVETSQRENELRRRLTNIEEDYSGLKLQSRKLMDSMQKDKDTKLQATAGRCKELQDEVESLRTVLDLRHEELQELRKQNAVLTREAEGLPAALQRCAGLDAKVEDLQVQLEVKTKVERQLSQDNRILLESVHQESKQNKRLSMHNEELQWKLKQNVEVVVAALSGAGSLPTPATNGRRSVHGSIQSLNDSDTSGGGNNQLFASKISPRPLSAGRIIHNSSGTDLTASLCHSNLGDDVEISPPASPKVKGVVEKSDSVSWVVEMEETPEALLSRLVRRAGSFRGTTPPPSSVSSPAHTRTLPPPKRQRCKAAALSLSSSATTISRSSHGNQSRNTSLTSSLRSRSRSVSTDSVEGVDLEYNSWNAASSTPMKNTCRDVCNEDMLVLINGNKSPLKRCGDEMYANDEHEGNDTIVRSSLKRGTSECSNDGDSPSKSPGSSGSSECGKHRAQKNGERLCHRSRKSMPDSLADPVATSDSLDLGDTEVLPLPPLPGSTSGDLSLLAAQPFAPMPKESGGEAMISEETSEDENDNEDGINSSSDEHSCSEDEESSSSESSSDIGPVASRGLVHEEREVENRKNDEEGMERALQKKEVSSGQQNLASSAGSIQQYHLLLMSDSGSYSATTTTMDLSWSEDMELMPSESEG